MLMTIAAVVIIGLASLVWARYRPHRDPTRMFLFAGTMVILGSVYRMAQTSPDTPTFRLHIGLILVMIVAMIYRTRRNSSFIR
jgi:hypothetical protein